MNLLFLGRARRPHTTVFPLQRLWRERRCLILVAGHGIDVRRRELWKSHVVVKRMSKEWPMNDILCAVVFGPESCGIDIG